MDLALQVPMKCCSLQHQTLSHHQTHPQLSVISALAQPLHSFWSVSQFSRSVTSDSLWPHESQHARPPCPSPTPGVHPDSSSRWCHPAISSSVIPFSSCPQSLPTSESFPMSQLLSPNLRVKKWRPRRLYYIPRMIPQTLNLNLDFSDFKISIVILPLLTQLFLPSSSLRKDFSSSYLELVHSPGVSDGQGGLACCSSWGLKELDTT